VDDGSLYAIGNHDPLSRGIVGDLKNESVVASPVYKQHFSLLTGQCLEDAAVSVPTFAVRLEDGAVKAEGERRKGSDSAHGLAESTHGFDLLVERAVALARGIERDVGDAEGALLSTAARHSSGPPFLMRIQHSRPGFEPRLVPPRPG
jgi:Rieske-like [2Fe-2S] domain